MREPKRASEFLRGILADARSDADRSALKQALTRVIGSELSGHCRILSLRGGKLIMLVDSAPLFAEFSGFRYEEIRRGMNASIKKQKISQIVFRMGGTGHV